MNTENFDNKINSLLKKYVFSESGNTSDPEITKMAEEIKRKRQQDLANPQNQEKLKSKLASVVNGDADEKPSTQTGKLST